METRDVKLRVELEVVGGQGGDPASPSSFPSNPAAPPMPGASTPDAGAGAGMGYAPATTHPASTPPSAAPSGTSSPAEDPIANATKRSVSEDDIERRILARVTASLPGLLRGATSGGGGLSDQLLDLGESFANAIPGGGIVAAGSRAARFTEKYGAAALAGAARVLPKHLRADIEKAQAGAERVANEIGEARSEVDAVGEAFEQTVDVAAGQIQFAGETDPAFLRKFFKNTQAINAAMSAARRRQDQRGRQAAGAAVGDLLGDALKAGMGVGQ